MSYYIFQPATDTLETGSQYPQVQKMRPGYDYNALNSVYALSRIYKEFPDFEPDLDYFVVHTQAKLTDLISASPVYGGFLISDKLKRVFEEFNIAAHKYYPARIKHKKNFYGNYFWMHIICDLTDFVDYGKSTFFIYYNYRHNIGTIAINSKKDYFDAKEKVMHANPGKTVTVWADTIHLTTGFDAKLDLFKIGTFNSDYYISDRLRKKIIQENISGCDISPARNLYT